MPTRMVWIFSFTSVETQHHPDSVYQCQLLAFSVALPGVTTVDAESILLHFLQFITYGQQLSRRPHQDAEVNVTAWRSAQSTALWSKVCAEGVLHTKAHP